MRVAQAITLDQQNRLQLERQARGRSIPVRVALRSRIVLLAADGLQNIDPAQMYKTFLGAPPSPRFCFCG
jgi:hypothetical protein